MNQISGIILSLLLVAVAFAPRRWALLAMMAGVFFLTQGHSFNLAGLSLFPIRLLEAAALARVVVRRELVWSQLHRLDWTLLFAYNYTALVWIMRSPELAAEQVAFALDPTFCYLALRGLMTKLEELRWLLVAFVPLLVAFTILVALERATGQTSFAMVGANWSLYVREGIVRCSGPFRHASLLGSVAAAFLALYVSLWWRKQDRAVAALGAALCAALVLLSNSGGPVTSALAAAVGWVMWPVRNRMRLVRYAMLGVLVFLILFMKAPIWYLPFKISLIVGGGGYHRGALMESAWNDLSQWWLFGMDLRNSVNWIPYFHPLTGGADITNQFIVFAIYGGLAGLVLLVLVLSCAFSEIGRKMKLLRLFGDKPSSSEALLWGLGVALSVHAVSWLGIAYFDQSWVIWLLHLSAVSAVVESVRHQGTEQLISETSPQPLRVGRPACAHGKLGFPARYRAGTHKRVRRLPWVPVATARKGSA